MRQQGKSHVSSTSDKGLYNLPPVTCHRATPPLRSTLQISRSQRQASLDRPMISQKGDELSLGGFLIAKY
ncbi:hypothetical protein PanWU01x14_077590 [Parasponia andersonii]|uniref:Uncharacterized protein n=1 Tax=Parasponia andersonii TaxID=3476 RepID=A0A2P5DBR1_PARAD|nr:hypothetical protein PanWU01x14_077590 [Parasponia andersonii]